MSSSWIDALFYNRDEPDYIIEGWVSKDGLMVRIPTSHALPLLSKFPRKHHMDRKWFFNYTFDREIAYYVGFGFDLVEANPQLLWQNGFEIIT